MIIKPTLVFSTPFYTPKYMEFYNGGQLREFLNEFDFSRTHPISRIPTGMPEFQLGTFYQFYLDGYSCRSDVRMGPRFLVARRVHTDHDGHIIANVAMDSPRGPRFGNVSRVYQDMRIRPHAYDAIIDLSRMQQLYPKCEESRSELAKFLTIVANQEYIIRNR